MKSVVIIIAIATVFLFIPVSAYAEEIPEWVKKRPGWWGLELLSDEPFIEVIQYLMNEGFLDTNPIPNEFPTSLRTDSVDWTSGKISNDKYFEILDDWIKKYPPSEQSSQSTSSNLESSENEQSQIVSEIDYKSIFNSKKYDTTATLTNHNDIPFYFEFDRSFTEPENNAYYELYKIIDSRNNEHAGDLRIYVGSSQWWNDNAFLQEKDTSGFSNIIVVKLFVLHLTDSKKMNDVANSLSFALNVLVPEWSKETSSVSSNDWFFDTLDNAKRNEENKREDRIIIENKEIRAINDDVGFGSMVLIVTENFDKTYQNYVSEPNELLEKIFDFSELESEPIPEPTQKTTQSEIIPQQAICGTGTIEKDGICIVDSTKLESKKSDTSISFQNIGVIITVGILVIIVGVIVMKKRHREIKHQKIRDGTYYDSRK